MISRHASFPMTKTGSKRVIVDDTNPNFQGIVLFPILSCTRVEYETHDVRYEAHYVRCNMFLNSTPAIRVTTRRDPRCSCFSEHHVTNGGFIHLWTSCNTMVEQWRPCRNLNYTI